MAREMSYEISGVEKRCVIRSDITDRLVHKQISEHRIEEERSIAFKQTKYVT